MRHEAELMDEEESRELCMNPSERQLLRRTSFQLTESDVYASEFCRRCCGVLNDEEEEWGLSQA